jgi:hypothetical protein
MILGSIASNIVSKHQRWFISGRHIQDCIMTSSEAVNLLSKKAYGGNLAKLISIKLLILLSGPF